MAVFGRVFNHQCNICKITQPAFCCNLRLYRTMCHFAFADVRFAFGICTVDEDFAQQLIMSDDLFIDEPNAYKSEHSLEVEFFD